MGQRIDTLALCTNANFIAAGLEQSAGYKHEFAATATPEWNRRLIRWAESDDAAARTIRGLTAEIERLRQGQ